MSLAVAARARATVVAPKARGASIQQIHSARRISNRASRAQLQVFAAVSTEVETATTNGAVTAPAPVEVPVALTSDLVSRLTTVQQHFPAALGVDDFIARVEIALAGFGFTGDNSIAVINVCRDEITAILKDKIETTFGSSFNTNGLGGVLTCGVTGIGAGLSHSPQSVADGKERYVFFSFPHVAVGADGALSVVNRPGRCGPSCACGALQKCLNELKAEGVKGNTKTPGVHDPVDPEYSILKQRLARRIAYEHMDIAKMDLADITKVAERTITDDLEFLIEKAVDTKKADYAVITGIQIHNWEGFEQGQVNLELVAPNPAKAYVVIDGVKTYLNILDIPGLTARQIAILAQASMGGATPEDFNVIQNSHSTLKEIPQSYLAKRMGWSTVAQTGTPASGRPLLPPPAVHTSFLPPVAN